MAKIYRKIALITIISFLLNGCVKGAVAKPEIWDWKWYQARPYLLKGLPEEDNDYTRGYIAGCKFEFAALATGFLRRNKMEVDGYKLTDSNLYSAGFSDGSEHCAYVLDWDVI